MRLRAICNLVFATLALTAACALPASAADNYTVKDSTGTTKTICSKDVGGVHSTCNVIKDSSGNTIDPATAGKQDTANTSLSSIDGKIVAPTAGTLTTTITRPADTTAYAANDALADSTSSPTSGGFTLSNACRTSGGSGMLTSLSIVSSNDPATTLQGEIWVFDSAVTAVNDNAAFALSDADALKLVPGGVVPFALSSSTAGSGTNSMYAGTGLNLGYTCVGSVNARFLVKVKAAYTPASGETLTLRAAYVAMN